MSFEQIEEMNTDKIKILCEEKIKANEFQYLDNKKTGHEKVKDNKYKGYEMAGYLKPNEYLVVS